MTTPYRAYTNCPVCNDYQEVWVQNGHLVFSNDIVCNACSLEYPGNEYLAGFIELYSNLTVSASIGSSAAAL